MEGATEVLAWPVPAASGAGTHRTSSSSTGAQGEASCFTVLEAVAALEAPETAMLAVLLLVLLIVAVVSRKTVLLVMVRLFMVRILCEIGLRFVFYY